MPTWIPAPERTAAPEAHQHGLSGHDYPGRQTPQSTLRVSAAFGSQEDGGRGRRHPRYHVPRPRPCRGQEGTGCGDDRSRDHLPALSLAPCAQRCRRRKPLAPRLTRSDPREAVTRRGAPQVHGGNLVRYALRPEATAAAEGCRDTTGAPLPHHHGGHWPTLPERDWQATLGALPPAHLALPRDDPDGRNSCPGESPGQVVPGARRRLGRAPVINNPRLHVRRAPHKH